MTKSLFLLIFFSILLAENSLGSLSCHRVYEAKYKKGHSTNTTSDNHVFVLGSGIMGGVVQRVFPPHGKSYLQKDYFSSTSLRNDVFALRILSQLAKNETEVRVLRPNKVLGDESLVFNDVRGFALNELPAPAIKKNLHKNYLYWAYKIMDQARARGDLEVNQLNSETFWIGYRVPKHKQAEYDGLQMINITLRPDNIIVDTSTMTMTLFDPY